MKRSGFNRIKKAVAHPVSQPKRSARVPPSPRPSARERALERSRARAAEPGHTEWKARHYGQCAVCGRRGRLVRHHVVLERHVRQAGGDPWDLRNALELGAYCGCHNDHHHPGVKANRIPLDCIPDEAIAFAIDLLGEPRAALYFARAYDAS